MSEFLKPQSPLQHKDGAYIYPLTTSDQVIMDDGSRLSGVNFLNFDDGVAIEGTANPINADTLGGRLASEFALRSDLDNIDSGISSWNDLTDKPFIPTKVSDLEQDVDMMPEVTSEDNGKLLMVVDGKWAVVELPNAKEATF